MVLRVRYFSHLDETDRLRARPIGCCNLYHPVCELPRSVQKTTEGPVIKGNYPYICS